MKRPTYLIVEKVKNDFRLLIHSWPGSRFSFLSFLFLEVCTGISYRTAAVQSQPFQIQQLVEVLEVQLKV